MRDRDASFSDLDLARSLSKRLTGEDRGAARETDDLQGQFVKFEKRTVPATAAAPFPEAAAAPPVELSENLLEEFYSWDDLLSWVRFFKPCQVAFVVDPEGFVIAKNGDRSLEELEGIGAQFQVVADEATRIEDGAATALCLKLTGSWLSGLRFSRDGSGKFLFCVIADEPLSRDIRSALSAQVVHNIHRL